MPPLSGYDEIILPAAVCSDNSSHSTVSVNASRRKPIAPASTRTVRFCEEVNVRFTICLDEYSPAEKVAAWYTSEDNEIMKSERKSTIKIMERGNPFVNDGQHYFRGLEYKTREGSRRRQFNQVDATMVVMDEQDAQQQKGIVDPEALAQIYLNCTMHCLAIARERALDDQRAALESVSVASPSRFERPQRRLSCRAA